MRLVFLTLFSSATSVLLLLQSCSAIPFGDPGASSSNAPAPASPPMRFRSRPSFRSSPSLPSRPPLLPSPPLSPMYLQVASALPPPLLGNDEKLLRPPPLERYIEYLDIDRINRLQLSDASLRDPRIPFYKTTPLFSITENPKRVEQALKKHQSAGIVDGLSDMAVLIQLNEKSVQQIRKPSEMADIVALYNLPDNVHVLKKVLMGQIANPAPQPVDHLPHAMGIPILVDGEATLEHMFAASTKDDKGFWIQQGRSKRHILIKPWTDLLFALPDSSAMEESKRVLAAYQADKVRYGDAYAGLRWGRPLDRNPTIAGAQWKKPNLQNYPRIESSKATYDQMIEALKNFGRFRFYVNVPGQATGAYTVELEHADTSDRRNRISVLLKPLERYKKSEEWLMSKLKGFKIPK
ncbi:uncharacterized protein SRS1_11237 [Sporisorium reilianum f. sp. reilianum]|uniref:Uncharacterized protein n=1 Tax=Sporisorium reilianum f. sp. reilianum TaxID=72559 RepID=A0A2N8UGA5_9BASI|nr:uncharacterized protein SRS1_11237 [Sporisorium reilianum f. sp. reilianum]